MRRSRKWPVAALGAAALVAGCGEAHHENRARPPEPVTITALIAGHQVRVSPTSLGAGPVTVLVSNQSGRAQRLTFETAGRGPGTRASTAVPLDGTAQLQVDTKRGRYQLGVRDRSVRPASIRVGRKRPSAQNRLLRP